MANKLRIRAFTIMEVIVVMLLSAITISISYTAYSIINRSYTQFQNKNSEMGLLMRFDRLLKSDFANADTISKTDSGIVFKSMAAIVNYKVDSNQVIRVAALTDTFKFHLKGINTLFEHQPINEFSADNEEKRLDELSFSIVFQSELIPCHYYKNYSSANLIERNTNAVN